MKPKMVIGLVYSSRGVAIQGRLDDAKTEAHMGDHRMVASYPLHGQTYGIAFCEECNREYMIENPERDPRVIWPLPGIEVPKEVPAG
ncbi:MAG TPA: hypothetical protein VGR71_06360 [Nitrospira sp.]|nr:hypothetical protein [Nitrospira sp.]